MKNSAYSKRGLFVRIIYLIISSAQWIIARLRRDRAARPIVLCYHGIDDARARPFKRQMESLSRWANGKDAASPIGPVLVTFDDAFENLLRNAVPTLREFRIPAIVFAVPGNFGRPPMWDIEPDHPERSENVMTAEQLKSVHGGSIRVGSHTQTHPDLSAVPPDEVRRELMTSKGALERLIGLRISDLALPHGAYNDEVLRIAEEAEYDRVYTLDPLPANAGPREAVVGRFSMTPDAWPVEFFLTCRGAYSWLFGFRRLVKRAIAKAKGAA